MALEAGAGILSWQEGSFFAVSVHRPATLENRPLSQLSKAQGTEEVTRGKTSLASRSGGGWQCYPAVPAPSNAPPPPQRRRRVSLPAPSLGRARRRSAVLGALPPRELAARRHLCSRSRARPKAEGWAAQSRETGERCRGGATAAGRHSNKNAAAGGSALRRRRPPSSPPRALTETGGGGLGSARAL